MQLDLVWDAALVAEALVRAFRHMPGYPVMSRGRAFIDHKGREVTSIAPLKWPERFVPDAQRRYIVLTWARCIATGESVRDRYDQLDWPRSSTERRRIAALQAIADGLNAEVEPARS